MTRISWIGVVLAAIGAIALMVDCPYGVHIIVAGIVVAIVGFFMRTPGNTRTGV